MRPPCASCKTGGFACTGTHPCVQCVRRGIQCEPEKTQRATVACLPCRELKRRCVIEDSICNKCRASGKETKCVFEKPGVLGRPPKHPEGKFSEPSKSSPGPGDSTMRDNRPNSKDVPLRYGWFIDIRNHNQLEGYFRQALDALAPHISQGIKTLSIFNPVTNDADQAATGNWS